ncbi:MULTISPECIES: SulP family inorganic anion transporter [unclassified Streptomyces]|uniref:SulP family inorganic anion transporter n=1 Tax=Streptomyces sp. NBC_00060 TaxID=2975636 RepID=A0AAU2HG24_9ACTN
MRRVRLSRADVTASLVVFLVALPLCVGVAVASGVPAELGLVTGIVGGLLTGLLPGSSLQVSGPAAGLTVLVYEAVETYGPGALGVLVLLAGLLQIALGALKLGRWFRAISTGVVQGMLAGIGVVLVAGQLYTLTGAHAHGSGLANLAGLPDLALHTVRSDDAATALGIGGNTIAILIGWPRLRRAARVLPAPLLATALATGAVALLHLPVPRLEVNGLAYAVSLPEREDFGRLTGGPVLLSALGTLVAFTLIASAESLFSAAAVDRLHDGPRTDFDKELIAQGVGNSVCGMLGSLPMTAVIVRSAANVQAGARTKLSRVLHGIWLLLFAAAFPAALGVIPLAALAGVLVHAGCKLIPVRDFVRMWRTHRAEAVVLAVTASAIVATNLFEGVLAGLLVAVAKSAWETSRVQLEVEDTEGGGLRVRATGNATFLRLPALLDQLEALPRDRPLELDLSGLRHLDHACATAFESWSKQAHHPARTHRLPSARPA